MDERNALTIGTMLRQYRIEKVIGQGGFGITYLAVDTDLQRDVAIKECYPRDFVERDGTTVVATSSDNSNNFEWALRKFVDEAMTLARFKHSGIVQVLQILKDENNSAYMVLEFVEGVSFDKWLKSKDGPPSEEELRAVIMPIFDALEVVHDNGIAHRDIAPDNIYIRGNGDAVLLDFGTAKQTVGHHTRTMNLVVKDGFSAPEQYYSEGRQGPWTDIYAFAATLYRAIAGKRPVDAMARQDALNNEEPDPLTPLVELAPKGYSRAFLDAVMLGLTLQAKRRPQSLSEWRAHLIGPEGAGNAASLQSFENEATHLIQPGEGNIPSVEPSTPQARKGSKSGRIVAAVVVLGLLAGGGYWFVHTKTLEYEARLEAERIAKEQAAEKLRQAEIAEQTRKEKIAQQKAIEARKAKELADIARREAEEAATKKEQQRLEAIALEKARQAEIAREKSRLAALAREQEIQAQKEREEATAWKRALDRDSRDGYQEFAHIFPESGRLSDLEQAVSNLDTPWSALLGGNASEMANAVAFNKDTIALGGMVSSAKTGQKGLIYLLSYSGKVRNRLVLAQPGVQEITDILLTYNGDIIISGHSRSTGSSVSKAMLMRLDEKGNVVWRYDANDMAASTLFAVEELSNGDLVAVGSSKTSGEKWDGLFLRLDQSGTLISQKTHGGDGDDAFIDVAALAGGKFAVAGHHAKSTSNDDHFWLAKLSSDGDLLWENIALQGGPQDRVNAIAATRDGQFFAVGETSSFRKTAVDGLMAYVDGKEHTNLRPIFMPKAESFLTGVVAAKDGGALIAGYTKSSDGNRVDGWIRKYDSQLKDFTWEQAMSTGQNERVNAIDILPDGSIMVVGSRATSTPGKTGLWVVKLGPNGEYNKRSRT